MKAHPLILHPSRNLFFFLWFLFSFKLLFGQSVHFDLTTLNFNGFTAPSSGTALKFGPDNKLYLAQLNGLIRVYTIEISGHNSYSVTGLETISHVRSIPNHDDIGTPAWDGRSNRQITGIEVVGTSENPIIYIGSSDPKWGGPSGDKVLDTNSGIITKLTWTGSAWDVVDLVRGLPRSEENHSINAVKFNIINEKPFLLVASGGFTNAGAPSTNFTLITEYALAAAILSIDLDTIEALPTKIDPNSGRQYKYNVPTLDDPSRPNVNGIYDPNHPDYDGIDVGDPWGGNDGLNMGMIVESGPVQVFTPGLRNAYDFVVTEGGKLYVTDNGPNTNWGGLPEHEGDPNTVTNNYLNGEPGGNSSNRSASNEYVTNRDRLLLITPDIQNYQPGSFYGGHPTPIRANPGNPYTAGTSFPFNPGGASLYTKSIGDEYNASLIPLYTPNEIFRTQILQPIAPGSPGFDQYAQTSLPVNWPPVPSNLSNPNEADYRDPLLGNMNGPDLEFVTIWKTNSNGLDEYKASNFDGALKGSIIAGRNQGFLHLVRLNTDGSLLSLEEDKWNPNGGNSLGINCQGDDDIFPGTIWVATFDRRISILTPSNSPFCPSPDDPFFDPDADYDNDGYTNQDEIDNGTDYCSGASRPNDFDGDFVSDLNDLDDDGDGIPDELDPFQLGIPTNLPIDNELFSDKIDHLGRPFGYRGLGLTGLMNNGAPNPNWLNWLDKLDEGPLANDIYGGAAGAIQIAITGGTANGDTNSQEKGFQFGVNVGVETGDFSITGGLLGFQGPQMFYDIDHNGEVGIQMGDGTQSNFLKLVFTKTGILAGIEINDIPDPNPLFLPLSVADRPLSSEIVEFIFKVNPELGTVEPQVKIGERPIISLGTKTVIGKILETIQESSKPLAIGVFGTSGIQGVEFLATYNYFSVVGEGTFPVGHWKMDEGSGNILVDHSGNGNNAVLQRTDGVSWSEGVIGLALNLNGQGGRFGLAPHSQSLEISGALTISAWVRPIALGNNTIISKADGNGFELWLGQNGQVEFRLNRGNNGTSYRLLSKYNYTLDIGKWIHVAATFDGTISRIFINGNEDISANYAPFTIGTTSGNLVIGALGTIQRFNGAIDDLRLYGRALSEGEIINLFDGETPLPKAPQLVAPVNRFTSVVAPNVQISWLTSEFATSYRIQLSTDEDFNLIVMNADINDIFFSTDILLPDTDYFWRVRSSNSVGNSDWSETRSFSTLPDGAVSDGPLGHWKMDEGEGNLLVDNSGNGNNAVLQNINNVFWSEGVVGLAVNLNGQANRFGLASHSKSLEISGALTISAWVRPNTVGYNTVISKADGNGFELWLTQNGQVEFRLNRGNNGAAYRLLSNYNYTGDVGKYIHVAATFDGTNSRIFINGTEDISATYAPFTIDTSSGDLVIGALGTIQRFNGAIDDLRLYGRALSVGEISRFINSGPLGHWKMDEGSGNTFVDHSGNGNHAVIEKPDDIFWSEGVIGLAVNLNGQGGRFGLAPHSQSLEIGDALTISAWVRPNKVGYNTIISKADGNGFELWLTQNGQIEFRLNRGNNGATYRLLSNYNYTGEVGKWIHVGATFDGTISRIFINGTEDISASYAPFTIGTTSGSLAVGALGTIQRFNGAIDDLRLFGRALENSEISDLYANENQVFRFGDTFIKAGIIEDSKMAADREIDLLGGANTLTGLFPNPVDNILNLKFSGYDETVLSITISDSRGVMVLEDEFEVNNGLLTIDLAPHRLSPGLHLLSVNSTGIQQLLKFIKK